jgi:hypothetical protein
MAHVGTWQHLSMGIKRSCHQENHHTFNLKQDMLVKEIRIISHRIHTTKIRTKRAPSHMRIAVSLVSKFELAPICVTATKILFNSGYPDEEASTSSRPKWKLMRNRGLWTSWVSRLVRTNCLLQSEPDMERWQVLLLPTQTQEFRKCLSLSFPGYTSW